MDVPEAAAVWLHAFSQGEVLLLPSNFQAPYPWQGTDVPLPRSRAYLLQDTVTHFQDHTCKIDDNHLDFHIKRNPLPTTKTRQKRLQLLVRVN